MGQYIPDSIADQWGWVQEIPRIYTTLHVLLLGKVPRIQPLPPGLVSPEVDVVELRRTTRVPKVLA